MQCEDVQRELANGVIAAELRGSVASHVAACTTCQGVGQFYARLDEALNSAPVWQPPVGFAQRMAARAAHLAPARSAVQPHFSSRRASLPLTTLESIVTNVIAEIAWRIAGPAWVMRQYWALVVNPRN